MAWGSLLFDLKSLFDLLVQNYDSESGRTRYFIRDFLFQLENAYNITLFHDAGDVFEDPAGLKFVQAKITAMVHKIRGTLTDTPSNQH